MRILFFSFLNSVEKVMKSISSSLSFMERDDGFV